MSSRILLVAFALGSLVACGDFERGDHLPTTETPTPTNGNGELSFALDAYPILIEYCEDCHNPLGEASSSDYLIRGDVDDDYETVLEFVDVESPSGSRLLTKARGTGHTGGVVLPSGSEEFTLLFDWIVEGAAP